MNGTHEQHQRDEDPIDQFLEMCETKHPESLKIAIQRALSHPRVFAGFSELLAMPNIQALADSKENVSLCKTLELYAYGSMSEYVNATPGTYIKLTSSQELKLKQLSVVSLVQSQDPITGRRPAKISYAELQSVVSGTASSSSLEDCKQSCEEMEESSLEQKRANRALEDLLISCFYSNLITGKLDQHNQMLLIKPRSTTTSAGKAQSLSQSSFISRDVSPSSIPMMIQQLEQWRNKSKQLTSIQLEQALKNKQTLQNEEAKKWKEVEEKIEEIRSKVHGGVRSNKDATGLAAAASASVSTSLRRAAMPVGDPGSRSRKRYYE